MGVVAVSELLEDVVVDEVDGYSAIEAARALPTMATTASLEAKTKRGLIRSMNHEDEADGSAPDAGFEQISTLSKAIESPARRNRRLGQNTRRPIETSAASNENSAVLTASVAQMMTLLKNLTSEVGAIRAHINIQKVPVPSAE